MADPTAQKQRYLIQHVTAAAGLIAAAQALRAARALYDARGYQGQLTDADLAAAGYGHLTAAQYDATLAAVEVMWADASTQAAFASALRLIP